jgi:hypothetical protein
MHSSFLCASLKGLSQLALSSGRKLSSDMLKERIAQDRGDYDHWVEVQTVFKDLVNKNDP